MVNFSRKNKRHMNILRALYYNHFKPQDAHDTITTVYDINISIQTIHQMFGAFLIAEHPMADRLQEVQSYIKQLEALAQTNIKTAISTIN